jgi:hypothetical protein
VQREGGLRGGIWINRMLSAVEELDVRRVFRNGIGDWCAYVEAPEGGIIHTAVFDHHPSVTLLRLLRNSGTDIAKDVIDQGAEGINVRWRATLSADDP